MPDFIRDKPSLPNGLEFYYNSFFDLSSSRQSGQGAIGSIPWASIISYCQYYDLSYEETEEFLYFIRKMDSEYITFTSKKHGNS